MSKQESQIRRCCEPVVADLTVSVFRAARREALVVLSRPSTVQCFFLLISSSGVN